MPPYCGVPGFLPTATGTENAVALQQAIDAHATVTVTCAATFDISDMVRLRSNTHLTFVDGAVLRKVMTARLRPFAYVFANRGAFTRVADENITIDGLTLRVNSVETPLADMPIPGLRGQLALFHVRNARIRRLRILDLGRTQFGVQVCAFEDLLIEAVEIRGNKDAIHLCRGRGFLIRNGTFQTADDALALNAHDYATSNPELGWVRDGVVEDCVDEPLPTSQLGAGFFARLLGGAWLDWSEGMLVRHSDSVVSHGGVYRVFDRSATHSSRSHIRTYRSTVRPTRGILDGPLVRAADDVPWRLVQRDAAHDAGIANVTFRRLHLWSKRPGIVLHLDANAFSRSIYPGAQEPTLSNISVEDVVRGSPWRPFYHAPDVLVVKTAHRQLRLNGVLCPWHEDRCIHGLNWCKHAANWCKRAPYGGKASGKALVKASGKASGRVLGRGSRKAKKHIRSIMNS